MAIGLTDEASPTLTHLVVAMVDGRLFYATGSTDGVMTRQVPVHLLVAGFKAFVGGKVVKDELPIEANTQRLGKAYNTFTLPSGMCALLCERAGDRRAFNWKRNAAKPGTGVCQLMSETPVQQADECCMSGAKTAAAAK